MNITIKPGKRKGIIQIPASKSDSQRAVLAAGLARGESILKNVGDSHDELAMLNTIQSLGATITSNNEYSITIKGIQIFPEKAEINVSESGLGCRLISSVAAANKGEYSIKGTGSILNRPMPFFENVLTKIGAQVESNNGYLPLKIKGPISGGSISFKGNDSSQYLSGLLMGLPLANEDTYIHVQELNSLPYVQMTINTLEQFGIFIQHQNFENYIIGGKQKYISCNYTIESDWSSASYWLVASALGMDIQLRGLTFASYQADKAILKAFESANCIIEFNDKTFNINGENRKSFVFDATNCPDLFPALVTFAALTEGKSEIIGVHRLEHKESNRGVVLKEEFEKLGVNIVLDGDVMHIYGKFFIEGGKTSAHNDHRIAMCLAIAGLFADSEIEIEGAEAVNKSYPHFWEHLENLDFEF
ncbi:MAG: 3-phosphoshikimate 1-carboxyvinyltransferase [Flavobacteriia bacterium]|nr:3-phosphoshikimate 1-carboxyvinyltransferase [Flavobacteriia bacterium]